MWLSWDIREGLLGTWGWGQKKRRENSFMILCTHKSCCVTVLERMLPLFANGASKSECRVGRQEPWAGQAALQCPWHGLCGY